MTLEQQYAELKKSKHLWPLMPRSKYLELVLQAQALLDQMERELHALESRPSRRMAARPPQSVGDEAKAKERKLPHAQPRVDCGAFLEATRRVS